MNKFWTVLLEKAVQKLIGADWGLLVAEVSLMTRTKISSDEKREYVVNAMRRLGYNGATWLLRAGIEVAYGMLRK